MTRTALIALAAVTLAACGQAEAPADARRAASSSPPAEAPATVAAVPDPAPRPHGPADGQARVEARYTPHFKQCLETGDAARGVTPAMAACFNAELALQDGALNAEYQRVRQALPPSEFVAVRDAQRQWIRDRDADCAAAASSGGTIDMVERPACLLDETIRRTMALEEIGAEGER